MDSSKTKSIVIGREQLSLPFDLRLNQNNVRLTCDAVLRFVPGRRAVFSGTCNGQPVVAKFFFKPFRYQVHVKKELDGYDLFRQLRLPTASILHSEYCHDINAHVLVFEYIESSIDLETIFKCESLVVSYQASLRALVEFVGRMHENGIMHTDLHPNNFLLKEETLYAIDGSAVKKVRDKPLDAETSLENLSILLSKLNMPDETFYHDLVDVYRNSRRDFGKTPEIAAKLETLMETSRQRTVNRYLKKIYRNSTQILCRKSFSDFMLCQRSHYTPAMAAFLENPDAVFHDSDNKILKAGNTATVVRCTIDGLELVVKRYNMKNMGHALRRAFKKTRADMSWRNAHLLMTNGIKTCRPIAMKERRFGPFRNKAYFVCEYLSGEDALHYFQTAGTEDKSRTAQLIIRLFATLESLMISHGDMKATNIIIRNKEPWLIDLDSMRQHKRKAGFSRAREKDVNRFIRNWQHRSDILAFFERLKA